MKWFKQATFRKKLLAALLVAGIVPLLVYLILALNVFRFALERSAAHSAEVELSTAASKLDRLFSSCEAVLEQLAGQTSIRQALRADGSVSPQDVNITLYNAATPLLSQADFAVYDAAGARLYATADLSSQTAMPVNWGLLRAAAQDPAIVYRSTVEDSPGTTGRMQLALAVRDGDTVAGYVVASLTQAHLQSCLLVAGTGADHILLLDRFWSAVYLPPALRDSALAEQLRSRLLHGQPLADNADCRYYFQQNPASGAYLVLQQSAPVSDGSMQLLYFITFLAVLLCIVLCVLVSMLLARQLIHPIRQLNEAMSAVEGGDLSVRLPVTGTDEFSQLTGRFNRMTARLKESWEHSLRQQQELSEVKIRMLQAQLNPHFLYNTLDTIKWLGKLHQVPEVATIAADLAKILRHAISADEFVTLGEELALLEHYVEIQQMRFSGRFTYEVAVEDEALRQLLLPKLVLQPLVENAILHGFEEKPGRIRITVQRTDSEALLTVEDDGQGRTPAEYARLLAEADAAGGHLGLYNVDTILRLNYGPERGLVFLDPPAGHGTCVRLCLPLTIPTPRTNLEGDAPGKEELYEKSRDC